MRGGLRFQPFYTTPGADPFDSVPWEVRDARITSESGEVVFEQSGIEVPGFWSDRAAQIAASHYFRCPPGSPRERSVRQMAGRVAGAIAGRGEEQGYFAGPEDARTFHAELVHILLHQTACFSSPIWYNAGIEERPQCAAAFILSVQDSVESILDLARTEGLLYKHGSGTGTNLSALRSSRERLAGGGRPSGPVSFMKGLDALAGMIRSGGRTRRCAKMAVLDADHPDVLDFIRCKALEERKAWALDAALDPYDTVAFQNANHSVRLPDEALEAALSGGPWTTRSAKGQDVETIPARDFLRCIAEAAWACGDPGVQYDTTINAWNPCPAAGRIRASNSCSEFLFLDDTACTMASVNLMRFHRPGGGFDAAACRHACEVMTTALDILIDGAGYPSPEVERNTRELRPLGLGYSNLGALLMARALPYDSDEARQVAAGITALVTDAACVQSSRIAEALGPFSGYVLNRSSVLRVLQRQVGEEALELAERHGLRNSQLTALAPTGTISFVMDCDTTGVEPDLALAKYKRMASGGAVRLVNRTVPEALRRLGYEERQATEIVRHLEETDTIEEAPHLQEKHLPVFDCALGPRSIAPAGHLRMAAAVQPFVSGGISKTVNLPESATPGDVERIFLEGWRLGLKAVAVYRDGCKRVQPLSTRGFT
jgi:ribonucleoside-diphosphate reductase alpha chain